MFKSQNRHLRSKLAYSFLTTSPVSWICSILGLYFTLIAAFVARPNLEEFSTLYHVIIPSFLCLVIWFKMAYNRWIPNRVFIPKTGSTPAPEYLEGCVELVADSLFNIKGYPVLAYNVNNYVGGHMIMQSGTPSPTLMAQFMHRYFGGKDGNPLSFDFNLFKQCYDDDRTAIYQMRAMPELGEEKHIMLLKLNKNDYCPPYTEGMQQDTQKPPMPMGVVIKLHLPEGSPSPYAFFLCSATFLPNSPYFTSDLQILELALNTLWRVADFVTKPHGGKLCLPLLGCGYSNMKEGKFSSIWTIVSTYRTTHMGHKPITSLHLSIPPQEIRRLDLREVLKLMNYALCG